MFGYTQRNGLSYRPGPRSVLLPTPATFYRNRSLPWFTGLCLLVSLRFVAGMNREALRSCARGEPAWSPMGRMFAIFMVERWVWLPTQRLRWAVRRAVMLAFRQTAINRWWNARP